MRAIFLLLISVIFSMSGMSETGPWTVDNGAPVEAAVSEDVVTGNADSAEGRDPSDSGSDDFLREAIEEYYKFEDLPPKIKAPSLQKFLLEKAVLVYSEGVRRYPEHERAPAAMFVIGEIHRVENDLDAGLSAYEAVIDLFDTNDYSDDARKRIAEIYFDEGEYEKAQENYYLLIDTYLHSELLPESYLMVARCYQEMMSYAKAIKTYKKTIELFDDQSVALDALTGLGDTYLADGDFAKALDTYQSIMADYPDSGAFDRAQLMSGRAYAIKGNYPAARKVLREIMNGYAMNEYIDDAAYEVGRTYFAEGKYAQAIQSYATAMLRYPDYPGRTEALQNAAHSYRRLFLYRDALLRYDELVDFYRSADDATLKDAEIEDRKTKIGQTLFLMGEIYHEQGDLEESLAKYFEAKEYLKGDDRVSTIDYSVAECYYELGWYREALEVYDSFIMRNRYSPNLLVALAHQAECYGSTGYFEQAQEKYLAVIATEPEEAIESSERLKSDSVFRVGELYAEQGMRREEAEFYESMLDARYSFLDEARIMFTLGTVYEGLGDVERAAASYQRVLDEFKDSDWYELARLNLEIIKINSKSRRED
jgi:tetratricopeptide (TPR) repeat protein